MRHKNCARTAVCSYRSDISIKGDRVRTIVAALCATGCLLGLTSIASAQEVARLQKPRGFAFEAHLGSQLVALTGDVSLGAMHGGFFGGYKLDRVIFGLGFDIARVATANRPPGPDTSEATTALYVTPGVRVAILRTADHRVEFFGQLDIGLGGVVNEESPDNDDPNTTVRRFRLFYNIGPGIRFWAHPQFAIGAVTGVHGDFALTRTTVDVLGTSNTTSSTTNITSIFAALQVMGVF